MDPTAPPAAGIRTRTVTALPSATRVTRSPPPVAYSSAERPATNAPSGDQASPGLKTAVPSARRPDPSAFATTSAPSR